MRHRIASAIAQVGHSVTVKHDGKSAMLLVSLQPSFAQEKDISGAQGYGNAIRYQLYHGWGAGSELLQEQAEIIHGSRKFIVERVDNFYYQSSLVYRKARLLLVEQ